MRVVRQDDETTINELVNQRCDGFVGAKLPSSSSYFAFYIRISGEWYRFFIHHGILFWKPAPPDPSDDLDDGDDYDDILTAISTGKMKIIQQIEMRDGICRLDFDDCITILVSENIEDGGMTLQEAAWGGPG